MIFERLYKTKSYRYLDSDSAIFNRLL